MWLKIVIGFIVYFCDWYLEYRVYICGSFDWKVIFFWEECCLLVGFDDRYVGKFIFRDCLKGEIISLKYVILVL